MFASEYLTFIFRRFSEPPSFQGDTSEYLACVVYAMTSKTVYLGCAGSIAATVDSSLWLAYYWIYTVKQTKSQCKPSGEKNKVSSIPKI